MKKIIQLQDLQPGTKYLVRARVSNKYDFFSEWSQTYELNVTSDDTKPSKPAKPTIQIAGPQKVVVSHDNTKQGGGALEFDVVSYKVFTNTTSSNSGGTLIHTMSATRPGSGLNSFATINVNAPLVGDSAQTLYFYVTAVDSAGNESDPSDATTGTPITYFDSAYISELTADKIRTGTLQANQSISVGTVAPIIIRSNETSPRGQIYIGTRVNPTGAEGSGYKDPQTAFYVDSTGKFSLKDQLSWDGNTLTINGYFKVGDSETTISGDQVRTGNIISNNYESNIPGQPQSQSNSFTNAGTWIDLDSGAFYSKGFYITGAGDVDGNGNPIPEGTARFKGDIFGARGIFTGVLPENEIPSLENPSGERIPTLIVESTSTDDGFLVFFKNPGTDAGVEFYNKQNDGSNWRRGSLSHFGGDIGGFLRLGAFPTRSGVTPGRIRIFAESTPDGKQGEIYLDARRTYAQKIFLTQPTTVGDWVNDPVTNFWKDPDGVSNGQDYFKVGSSNGSAITVRKRADGTDKVVIKDYEIEGVSSIIDDSKITVNTVEIGKGVGGAGKHGIKINGDNYWYDPSPSTFGNTEIVFRAGGSGNNALIVRKNGSVSYEGETNPTGGTVKGKLTIQGTTYAFGKDVMSLRDGLYLNENNYWTLSQTGATANFNVGGANNFISWNGSSLNIQVGGSNVATQSDLTLKANATGTAILSLIQQSASGGLTGVSLTSAGQIYSSGKTSFDSATAGWYLGFDSGTPRFGIGDSNNYMRWNGSSLQIQGNITGSTFTGGTFRTGSVNENRVEMIAGSSADRIQFPLIRTTDNQVLSETQSAYIRIIPTTDNDGGFARILELRSPIVTGFNPSSAIKLMTGRGTTAGNSSRLIFETPWVVFSGSSGFTPGSQTIQLPAIPDYSTTTTTASYVLGSAFGYQLAWFDAADFAGGGGASYTSADVNGIIVNNTTDTIDNAGFRKVGTTTSWTATRTNEKNRITYGATLPGEGSGRSDGDIHIEF